MDDETLNNALRTLNERTPVTLRRHEHLSLARLSDAESDRYRRLAARKNSNPDTASANLRSAGAYARIASEIRRQTAPTTTEEPTTDAR